jgi:hypothetical protein
MHQVSAASLPKFDTVAIEVRKVDHRVQMSPEVRAAFERSMERYKDDYDYLGEN